MADGTSFQIDVDVQAGSAEPAAASLATLADRLTAAGAASTAAADAVKQGEAAYRQAEASADRAAKALEKISVSADAQRGKLAAALDAGDVKGAESATAKLQNLIARQAEAAAKADAAKTSLAGEAAALDKLKAAASSAADAEGKAAKALEAGKRAADASAKAQAAAVGSGKVNEIAEGLGKLGGPLGQIGQKAFGAAEGFKKLGASLGSAGPYVAIAVAAVAVATGIAAITAAALVGVGAVLQWGVGLADAARSNRLLAEGIAKTEKGGAKLESKIDELANTVPIAREELMSMAAELAKTGLEGDELTAKLEDTATEAAKLKFGPNFAKQMLSLNNQSIRLKSNLAKTFGGLGIEKLLEGLSHLVELFDTSNASGQAMKTLFESIFQPIVDGIADFLPKARSAFIQFEILVMKAAIAIKPFGSDIVMVAEVVGALALAVGVVLAAALAFIIANLAILAVGVGLVSAAVVALVAGVIWLGAQLWDLGSGALNAVVSGFNAVVAWFQGFSLQQIGVDLINGLVAGITGAGPAVLSALGGIVTGAIGSAKKLLGIASPSKVFAEIGNFTGEGMAQGVEGSTDAVQGSMEAMVDPSAAAGAAAGGVAAVASPADGGKGAAAAKGGEGGAGSGTSFAGATFVLNGVEGAEDAEARIGALLTRLLEGDVASLGGAVGA